jgi:putative transcriptional regulator
MAASKAIGAEIIEGLEEFVDALKSKENISQKFNCRKIVLDLQPRSYSPALVKQTRTLLAASQAVFAQFLGVSVQTVRAWEQGKNPPQDVACRLMDEIRHDPDYWRKRLLEMAVSKASRRQTHQA